MAWLCVDKDGTEWITSKSPFRDDPEYAEPSMWNLDFMDAVELPHGSIQKLIGRLLTWDDNPVEIK